MRPNPFRIPTDPVFAIVGRAAASHPSSGGRGGSPRSGCDTLEQACWERVGGVCPVVQPEALAVPPGPRTTPTRPSSGSYGPLCTGRRPVFQGYAPPRAGSRATAGTHPRPTPEQGATHCPAARGHSPPRPDHAARGHRPPRHGHGSRVAWHGGDALSPHSGRAHPWRPDRAARGHSPPRHGRQSRAARRSGDAPSFNTGRALPRCPDRAASGHSSPRHSRGSRVAWYGGDAPPPHTGAGCDALPCGAGPLTPAPERCDPLLADSGGAPRHRAPADTAPSLDFPGACAVALPPDLTERRGRLTAPGGRDRDGAAPLDAAVPRSGRRHLRGPLPLRSEGSSCAPSTSAATTQPPTPRSGQGRPRPRLSSAIDPALGRRYLRRSPQTPASA